MYYDVSPVNSEDWYHSIFPEPTRRVIGEGSVSYLFYPEVAQRIYDYNPEARILIILRNPIQRAFSHYLMDCRLGLCDISLEEILDNPSKYPYFYQQFIDLGMYHQQIKRYIDVFGQNQVKVMFYDDLKTDANLFVDQVFSFLALPSIDVNIVVKNKFKKSPSIIVASLYKFKWLRSHLNSYFPKRFLLKIKSVLFKDSEKPILNLSIKRKLSEIYKKDVAELSKLLSKDFSAWE